MSKYTALELKVYALIGASLRCLNKGCLEMALMWSHKATELKSIMLDMSVEEAGQKTWKESHILILPITIISRFLANIVPQVACYTNSKLNKNIIMPLFKLKEIPLMYENMMSNEKAEEYYQKGNLPFNVAGYGNGAVRVSCGFYSKHLSFAEWVDQYKLKII